MALPNEFLKMGDEWEKYTEKVNTDDVAMAEQLIGFCDIPEELKDRYFDSIKAHHDYYDKTAETIGRSYAIGHRRGMIEGMAIALGGVALWITVLVKEGMIRRGE